VYNEDAMVKNINEMTHLERMTAFLRELPSPKSVATAAKLIEQIQHELLEAQEAYKMAVRRHGEIVSAPAMPAAKGSAEEEAAEPHLDTTIESLAADYCADSRSTYGQLRFRTRKHYDGLIRNLIDECGKVRLADIKARDIEALHEKWVERGASMAHALVGMLRILFNFGAKTLEDKECERIAGILHRARFSPLKQRRERLLTEEQVLAVIRTAREMDLAPVALAQAFQFGCSLAQRDVIGEWVPESEPGESTVVYGGQKWLRGLRWEEIDSDLILRHTTSKVLKEIEIDLKTVPMVMEELQRYGGVLPTKGPIITSKRTGLPYDNNTYRTAWRKVADAAGIPKEFKNMDSNLREGRSRRAGHGMAKPAEATTH
jgi:hypothetical protein